MNSENSTGDEDKSDLPDPEKLQTVIDRWPKLTPEVRNAISVLAQGTLPRTTEQEVIALIEPLPPIG